MKMQDIMLRYVAQKDIIRQSEECEDQVSLIIGRSHILMIIITQKMLFKGTKELHLCKIDCLLAFLFFHLYIIHKLIIIDIINLEYFRPKKFNTLTSMAKQHYNHTLHYLASFMRKIFPLWWMKVYEMHFVSSAELNDKGMLQIILRKWNIHD